MKRIHVHSKTHDLARSVDFYTSLFGSEPSILKPDYAKWMLDNPRVNFAVSLAGEGQRAGIEHLGLQAETADELAEIYEQLVDADAEVLEEGQTTCCYAKSEKSWVSDPNGIIWEAFYTQGSSTVYGDPGPVEALSQTMPSKARTCCPV